MKAVSKGFKVHVIPMDGKLLRRSHDKGMGKAVIEMVSAWATTNHLMLGR